MFSVITICFMAVASVALDEGEISARTRLVGRLDPAFRRSEAATVTYELWGEGYCRDEDHTFPNFYYNSPSLAHLTTEECQALCTAMDVCYLTMSKPVEHGGLCRLYTRNGDVSSPPDGFLVYQTYDSRTECVKFYATPNHFMYHKRAPSTETLIAAPSTETLIADVGGLVLANQAYWQAKCPDLPAATTHIKVVMGTAIDYFRPNDGRTVCDMLTTYVQAPQYTNMAPWDYSNDGTNWAPGYSIGFQGRTDKHLGGSTSKNTETGGNFHATQMNGDSDQRYYLSFWGHERNTGGCCSDSPDRRNGGGVGGVGWWKVPFKLYAIGAPAAPVAPAPVASAPVASAPVLQPEYVWGEENVRACPEGYEVISEESDIAAGAFRGHTAWKNSNREITDAIRAEPVDGAPGSIGHWGRSWDNFPKGYWKIAAYSALPYFNNMVGDPVANPDVHPGWKPFYAMCKRSTPDTNECSNSNQCGTNESCVEEMGSFSCVCNTGFESGTDGCVDIDECSTGAHQCSGRATCTNTPGSYECPCNAGFQAAAASTLSSDQLTLQLGGETCFDIDECAKNADNCDSNADCSNTVGSFECACRTGYGGDGVTCIEGALSMTAENVWSNTSGGTISYGGIYTDPMSVSSSKEFVWGPVTSKMAISDYKAPWTVEVGMKVVGGSAGCTSPSYLAVVFGDDRSTANYFADRRAYAGALVSHYTEAFIPVSGAGRVTTSMKWSENPAPSSASAVQGTSSLSRNDFFGLDATATKFYIRVEHIGRDTQDTKSEVRVKVLNEDKSSTLYENRFWSKCKDWPALMSSKTDEEMSLLSFYGMGATYEWTDLRVINRVEA